MLHTVLQLPLLILYPIILYNGNQEIFDSRVTKENKNKS